MKFIFIGIFTGIFAGVLAIFFNKYVLTKGNYYKIVYWGPLVEELLKTILAILFGASIALSHAVFGIVEAVLDYKNTKDKITSMVSFISHTFLGTVTKILYDNTGFLLPAILTAYLIHLIWNKLVMIIINTK
jgi:hypothetical protein